MKISFNRLTVSALMITGMAFLPVFAQGVHADATSTNLVVNGSFEAPVVTNSDKWDIFPSGTPGLGWTIEWESRDATTYDGYNQPSTPLLELQQNGHLGYNASDGNQWAELDTDWTGPNDKNYMSFPASVNIYQDIPTIPGDQYSLSFDFSPRADAPNADENILNVSWDGSQKDSISRQNNSGTQNEWQAYSYNNLVATASTTRLEFSDGGIPDGVGTYLDNVVLTDMSGGNGGGGGAGTTTGTTTATTTDPGNGGGGGAGTTTATSTDPGNGGGGGSSSGGGSSPVVTASGYGGSGGGAPSSGAGQVLGASTGPGIGGGSSAPAGSVLGDSTSTLPNMPYTGTDGNATLTYLFGYIGMFLASEALISRFGLLKSKSK